MLGSPSFSDHDKVEWSLDQHDRFKAYLSNHTTYDLDTLVTGKSIFVYRDQSITFSQPLPNFSGYNLFSHTRLQIDLTRYGGFIVSTSHSRMTPSSDADAILVPCGENATDFTHP